MSDEHFSYPHDDTAERWTYSCLRCGATVHENCKNTHMQWHDELQSRDVINIFSDLTKGPE